MDERGVEDKQRIFNMLQQVKFIIMQQLQVCHSLLELYRTAAVNIIHRKQPSSTTQQGSLYGL